MLNFSDFYNRSKCPTFDGKNGGDGKKRSSRGVLHKLIIARNFLVTLWIDNDGLYA